MAEPQTPQWLVETQNKSWEPEIILSGITLTSLFLLPNYLFNFFGMLVQDYGVWDALARSLYTISMVWLTGLKLGLIVHLVMRGLWVGLVGVSYVFPHGVRTERLAAPPPAPFERPAHFVIKIERICSLLFSFIFASVMVAAGMLLLFVPMTLLFFTGLDLDLIRAITLYALLPGVLALIAVAMVLLETKWKHSRFKRGLETSLCPTLVAIYMTNLGRGKTLLLFAAYFVVIVGLCRADLDRFAFENDANAAPHETPLLTATEREDYEDTRDGRLRIQRATLGSYQVGEPAVELFVALYEDDEYTLEVMAERPQLRAALGLEMAGEALTVASLCSVLVDGEIQTGLRWRRAEHPRTGQRGLVARIPVRHLPAGIHRLRVRKLLWSVVKGEMRHLERWQVLPFEVVET